ncbi:hypothetical protein WJX77_000190 [Trebouxia sp. C0004]
MQAMKARLWILVRTEDRAEAHWPLADCCESSAVRADKARAELLYMHFFPKEAEAQAEAKGEAGIADQFIAYINKETPFGEATMRLASKSGAPPERLWNLVKNEANGFDTYQALRQTKLG